MDLQATIYDVQSVKEQHRTELRKAGLELTRAMRNLKVEHGTELRDIDATIKAAVRKKKYVQLAFECCKRYVQTGSLSFEFEDEDDLWCGTGKDVFDKNDFDLDLFKSCIAKHGFVYVSHEARYLGTRKLKLRLASSEDEEAAES